MSCQVLGVACSVSAWLRSVVAEHGCGAEARTVHQENPAPISQGCSREGGRGGGGGGRGGVVETFWKGGVWSVLKTLALGRVPSTPPSPDPLEECPATPPPPPSGSLERARSSFWGKVTGFISLPFSSRSAPLLRQAAFHRNWARRKIWRRHSACQLFQ